MSHIPINIDKIVDKLEDIINEKLCIDEMNNNFQEISNKIDNLNFENITNVNNIYNNKTINNGIF